MYCVLILGVLLCAKRILLQSTSLSILFQASLPPASVILLLDRLELEVQLVIVSSFGLGPHSRARLIAVEENLIRSIIFNCSNRKGLTHCVSIAFAGLISYSHFCVVIFHSIKAQSVHEWPKLGSKRCFSSRCRTISLGSARRALH